MSHLFCLVHHENRATTGICKTTNPFDVFISPNAFIFYVLLFEHLLFHHFFCYGQIILFIVWICCNCGCCYQGFSQRCQFGGNRFLSLNFNRSKYRKLTKAFQPKLFTGHFAKLFIACIFILYSASFRTIALPAKYLSVI